MAGWGKGWGVARKLRVQYPGAIYQLMNRGDRREPIFKDDADRAGFPGDLGPANLCQKFDEVKGSLLNIDTDGGVERERGRSKLLTLERLFSRPWAYASQAESAVRLRGLSCDKSRSSGRTNL